MSTGDGAAGEPRVPCELRVHGVGGPQATKMLGELHEQDIVTIPAFSPDASVGPRLPRDTTTRFAQRIHEPHAEAYEWGALNAGSGSKALWVLYLPFTVVNAAGWAHAPRRPGAGDADRLLRVHLALTHVVAYLATLTYVAWIGYLTLELVARDWVVHVDRFDRIHGFTADFVLVWTPVLAPALCIAVVTALFLSVSKSYEEVLDDGDRARSESPWQPVPSIADPGFFAHVETYEGALAKHRVVAFVALVAIVFQYVVGVNRLGVVLFAIGAAQVAALLVLTAVDLAGRHRRWLAEEFPALIDDEHLANTGARLPAGAAFATLGTVFAHAAFAGLALTLSPLLAAWPKETRHDLELGAELAGADVYAWAVVLFVLFGGVVLLRSKPPGDEANEAGPAVRSAQQRAVLTLARRTPWVAFAALAAVAIPVLVYIALNVRGVLEQESRTIEREQPGAGWEQLHCESLVDKARCWYATYDVGDDAVARRLGSLVLVLPGAVYGALWRKHDTGFGRVVGNVWDVLTFWPRRFHPCGAPCSAERAVPELRARIRYVLRNLPGPGSGPKPFVVVAHSQGSVLAAAAIASLSPEEQAPSLVTFGSPLGTLYAPTWPAYIADLVLATKTRVDRHHPGLPWQNYWRLTDPVGAGVPAAANHRLGDPQMAPVGDLARIRALRPLERPQRWGSVAGHSSYLADQAVQDAIEERRPRP
jgi:uncharacterized membrane protein YfbV (UPF0208 family)